MAKLSIEQSHKVFREGPLADTIATAIVATSGLFKNDSMFDINIEPEPTEISVNPYGTRGEIKICEETNTIHELDGREIVSAMVEVTQPDYVAAQIIDDTYCRADIEVDLSEYFEADKGGDPVVKILELFAVDENSMEENLELVLQCVLAAGYMAGRRDQILDLFSSNEQRFVKAKDLGPVIDMASSPTQPEFGIFTSFSSNRDRTLEALRELRGVLKKTGIKQPDLAIEYIDYQQIVPQGQE